MAYIYIFSNCRGGSLYIGVTNDLGRRIFEHKEKLNKGFASKYNITRLVYNEYYESINDAIVREKQLKNWKRKWKVELIEKMNPDWKDLSYDFFN